MTAHTKILCDRQEGLSMIGETDIIFEVQNIQNVPQMTLAVIDLREHYEQYRLPQPALPDNVLQLAPCSIKVTETHGAGGLRTGKVLITDSDGGETIFEKEWLVSPGKS